MTEVKCGACGQVRATGEPCSDVFCAFVPKSSTSLSIELACVESVIENEIAQGASQKAIAETFAMALVSSWPTDWKRVNAAIVRRWPRGLELVKEMGWAIARKRSHGDGGGNS